MKQILFFLVLFFSSATFSQSTNDSIIAALNAKIDVLQQQDLAKTAQIVDIEKRLTSHYVYNRRYHSLLYVSIGLSAVSFISAQYSPKVSIALPLAAGITSLIGTVIYLDSYKFLNFKPKKIAQFTSTYY